MTSPRQVTGASADADQALAVPVEPASGLAPSGFDPSRVRKYRRRGEVTAVQWFKLGDHPGVIRRERWPEPRDECWVYWVGRLDAGWPVNPGDWICTDESGLSWPKSPNDFERMFQPCDNHEAVGVYIGVNDSNGQPVHIGDTLAFDTTEWGEPHEFVVRLEGEDAATRLSGEAMPARAAEGGIAQPESSQ